MPEPITEPTNNKSKSRSRKLRVNSVFAGAGIAATLQQSFDGIGHETDDKHHKGHHGRESAVGI